jgi:hypothetical protein
MGIGVIATTKTPTGIADGILAPALVTALQSWESASVPCPLESRPARARLGSPLEETKR